MTQQEVKAIIYDYIIAVLKMNAPKDTGNLAMNSIRLAGDRVVIGGEIAEYAVYTEENNRSSKGWIKNTINSILPYVESMCKNNISKEEIIKMTEEANESVKTQFEDLAKKYVKEE